MNLNIRQATQLAKKQTAVGWVLTIISTAFFLVILIKFAYFIAGDAIRDGVILFDNLFLLIQALIKWFYSALSSIPLIGDGWQSLWSLAPMIDLNNLLATNNAIVGITISLMFLGAVFRLSGKHLNNRISTVHRKAEEKRWERSITGESVNSNIMAIEIDITSSDQWYKRPFGLISIAVIAGCITSIFNSLI